ncbi:hypothetical protein [Pedobacter agri]|uniref:Uncharacterized protein n=1 Tax=Pedobacter agri TaxID=454586 RepID=A0A9X3DF60_9SPHI|nr:hypothetical protein [Pedobacter agri]MCX3266537.1 hypothetical protein [Pedobacter agri]MDQ1139417.1 hypothetical protein [Pedobacter agri]
MDTLLWETSWKNYMLYLGAIQSDEAEPATEKMEVKDASELF